MAKEKHIIVGVTASVAIYKTCDIIRRLIDEKLSVSVVMTKESQEFIRPALFRHLAASRVYGELFDAPGDWEIEHVSLAERADTVLIVPATANIIGKLACGICDDLLTCVVCATKAPVLICPAMNENMYLNRIVQDNIARLKRFGCGFVEPKRGKLACGKVGVGCLADVDIIIKELKNIL